MYTFQHIQINKKEIYFQLNETSQELFCPFATIQGEAPDRIKEALKGIDGISFDDTNIRIANSSDFLQKYIPKIIDNVKGVRTVYNPIFFRCKLPPSSQLKAQSSPDLSTQNANLSMMVPHSGSSPRLSHHSDLTLNSLIPENDPNLEEIYRRTAVHKSQIFTTVGQTSTDRHSQKNLVTSTILFMGYTFQFTPKYHEIKHRQVLKLEYILTTIINPLFLESFPGSAPSKELMAYFRNAVLFVMDDEMYNHNNELTYGELETKNLTYTPAMREYRESLELEMRAKIMLQHWMFFIEDEPRLTSVIASMVTDETLIFLKRIKFAIKLKSTLYQDVEMNIKELSNLIIESGKAFREHKLTAANLEIQYKKHEPIQSAVSTPTNIITFISFRTMMIKLLADYNLTPENHDAIFMTMRNMLIALYSKTDNAKPFIEKLQRSDKDFYLLDEWGIEFMKQCQINLESTNQQSKSLRKKESSVNLLATHFTQQFEKFILEKINVSSLSPKSTLSKSMGFPATRF